MLGFHPLSQEPISALEAATPVIVESSPLGVFQVRGINRGYVVRNVFHVANDDNAPVVVLDTNPSDLIRRWRSPSFSRLVVHTANDDSFFVEANPHDSIVRWVSPSFARLVVHTANDDSVPVVVIDNNPHDSIARRFRAPGFARLVTHTAQDDSFVVVETETNPHDAISRRFSAFRFRYNGLLFHSAQDDSVVLESNPSDFIVRRWASPRFSRVVGHTANDDSAPVIVVDTNPSDWRLPPFRAFKLPNGKILLYLMNTANDLSAPPPPAGGGGHKVPDLRRKGLTWVRYRR